MLMKVSSNSMNPLKNVDVVDVDEGA